MWVGSLSFQNAHTGDFINIRYCDDKGRLDGSACRELSHFFRCHLTDRALSSSAQWTTLSINFLQRMDQDSLNGINLE